LVAADSCGPLAEELISAYEEAHPWVTVQVEVFNSLVALPPPSVPPIGGEERGGGGAGEDRGADLALLSWLQETADGEQGLLWSQPFTRDGIAIVFHPAMPLTEIGLVHLQEIFRGRVQEWDGVVLTAVSREEGSGTRAVFESVVMDGFAVGLTAVVMPSSEAVIEYVARTPGAIGYVSTLWVRADAVRRAGGAGGRRFANPGCYRRRELPALAPALPGGCRRTERRGSRVCPVGAGTGGPGRHWWMGELVESPCTRTFISRQDGV